MRKIIFGIGFLLSGSIGVASGNLEKTLFYTSPRTDNYIHSPFYYVFIVFLIIGLIYSIVGLKDDKKE